LPSAHNAHIRRHVFFATTIDAASTCDENCRQEKRVRYARMTGTDLLSAEAHGPANHDRTNAPQPEPEIGGVGVSPLHSGAELVRRFADLERPEATERRSVLSALPSAG
jgi:hypothetical protein